MECKANEDTQCDCVTGYYCNEPSCDHCRHVTHCPVGEGVKVKATRVNDTICAPCQSGTFSNVSDFTSVCQRHTSCEDNGKVLETPGTSSADAVCGGVTSRCPWMLPTGLVLTSLIVLLAIIIWRTKCKSYKTAFCSFSNAPVDPIPAADVYSVELPLPLTELNDHCQESCLEKDCQPSLFDTDPMMVDSYTLDSAMNDRPVQTGSVHAGKFNNHINGKTENCTTNYLRTHSEPQEDEWRGT
ncbi:tumor necrosis factor receptor superfamily member 5 [Polymixia lowei]